ncbi:glycosyltransferase family 92 protein RCOM_0530710 [Andrographis paniculata]|uniref:glycosyltransferase family 92 protein RCOM_0530710 n=1 Tax=Andrographis paniculata TaxID=175694 RepID=UPI0021E7FAB5|nr:glycosyltransferase family 92 protein RCOM_0530710 [Andrographis paniculata]
MTMARKVRSRFLLYVILLSLIFCTTLYRCYLRRPAAFVVVSSASSGSLNFAIRDNLKDAVLVSRKETAPLLRKAPNQSPQLSATAVLLPEWEVLLIVSPETTPSNFDGYLCLFQTDEISPARFSGFLPFPNRATFGCLMPARFRRRRPPWRQPVLLKSSERKSPPPPPPPPPPLLLRWSYLVYDSLTTDNDVVLFAKGVNHRQGINRSPSEFRCVFRDNAGNSVRTVVTSSTQEVFRCKPPDPSAISGEVMLSLVIVAENHVVPSIAYYTRPRTIAPTNSKSLLCATTMVYNVTKYLKEWILYHSKIGVDKFLLYDNGSDDDLEAAVRDLVGKGFDVNTYPWRWPKTQESGFSHSVLYARKACTWMMYLDVDEFIYSPSWKNLIKPSKSLLQRVVINSSKSTGQITVSCHEFGPSGQSVHPPAGVTQGYNCRRKLENRHKSIVLLHAVDHSLLNVVHHFELQDGYKTRKTTTKTMAVNHYKYQAWPEFKSKFRRRVSAYVLDWTQKSNPSSKDRTPGLGFEPVEPPGWPQQFCEVRDNNLKVLVSRWFGFLESDSRRIRMPWQEEEEDDEDGHFEIGVRTRSASGSIHDFF